MEQGTRFGAPCQDMSRQVRADFCKKIWMTHGVGADASGGAEVVAEGAHKAEDAVFAGLWDGVSRDVCVRMLTGGWERGGGCDKTYLVGD